MKTIAILACLAIIIPLSLLWFFLRYDFRFNQDIMSGILGWMLLVLLLAIIITVYHISR